jgi:hypothetical protein
MRTKPCTALAAMMLLSVLMKAQSSTTAPPSGQSLNLYLANPAAMSPYVLETLHTEIEDLLHPTHLAVHWHDGRGEVAGQLAVIRIQGECQAYAPPPTMYVSEDVEALGRTHVSNGVVLPFADIRCDELRRFIGGPLRSGHDREAREQMLGRALARVIAHELYHILLKTRSHGKSGIARASQTAAQLVAPRVSFSRADERKLSSEVAHVSDAGDAAGSAAVAADAEQQRDRDQRRE